MTVQEIVTPEPAMVHLPQPGIEGSSFETDQFGVPGVSDPFIDRCPPWCEYRERGHRLESRSEDRNHYSEIVTLLMELEDPVAGDGASHALYPAVTVGLAKNYRMEPQIHIEKTSEPVFKLSVREARMLAELLLNLADQAEGLATP
jgi:hypothetical protein